jgi:transcriptional regulator with XRE-family HTH domain
MPRVSTLKLPPLDVDPRTIGVRLSQLRKEKGYTQIDLARKTGLTQALISSYERSRLRMNAETVIRFAKALNVSTDDILGLSKSGNGKDRVSLRLVRRLNRIESLPKGNQKTILKAIDFMIQSARDKRRDS